MWESIARTVEVQVTVQAEDRVCRVRILQTEVTSPRAEDSPIRALRQLVTLHHALWESIFRDVRAQARELAFLVRVSVRESTGPQMEDVRILVQNHHVLWIVETITIDKDAETHHQVRVHLVSPIVVLETIDKDVEISLRVRVRHVLRTADRVNFVLDVVILRKVRARRATRLRVPLDNISTGAPILRLEHVLNVPTSQVAVTTTTAQTVVSWMHVNILSVRQVVVWDPIDMDVKVPVLVRVRLVRCVLVFVFERLCSSAKRENLTIHPSLTHYSSLTDSLFIPH